MAEKMEGNPAAEGLFDAGPEITQDSTQQSNEFFDALDESVNGQVINDVGSTQVTQPKTGVDTGTHTSGHQDTDWKKRYSDSTREAQKMRGRLQELEPYSGLLDVMRKDPQLIDTVKDYLNKGGQPPKDMKEAFNLPEDFEFDANEAIAKPDSQSGQVFESMMDNYVTNRVNEVVGQEKQQAAQAQVKMNQQIEAKKFQEEHKLSDAQMEDFLSKSQTHTLTLDDAWLIVNRENRDNKIAKAQSADMRKQMNNVNSVPNTVSGQNNVGQTSSPSDSVFDILKGDGSVDNLFGNN